MTIDYKIMMISYMDFLGAGNAARKIYEMLKTNGVNVELFVKEKKYVNSKIFHLNEKQKKIEKFFNLKNIFLNKVINNRITNNFSYSHKSLGWFRSPYADIINNNDHDIVQLHWISNFLSIEDIGNIKKPIVWRFSDMWPFTGINHYEHNIDNTFVTNGFDKQFSISLDKISWKKKKLAWKKKFFIVTPSQWMKKQVLKSYLMKDNPVETIYTPIDTNIFKPLENKIILREKYKIEKNSNIILFGADNLNDKRKGLNKIIDIFKENLINKKNFYLILFGNGNVNEKCINNLNIKNFGYISESSKLNELFNLADVMVIPSDIDNLPQVGLEAQSSGLPVITLKNSGLEELIEDKKTGFLSDDNIYSISKKLEYFFGNEDIKKIFKINARSRALNYFDSAVIMQKYNNLYSKILKTQNKL